MFNRSQRKSTSAKATRFTGFEYLDAGEHYLDAACQSLRPVPVQQALTEYYTEYNACGGRVKYAWGRKIDEQVENTRAAVLDLLKLSGHQYVTAFTLNTTYGINLLLSQLPKGKFERIVTSHIEHNSVFLPTMTAATRMGIERIVLDRASDGALIYTPAQLNNAIVVVNVTSNIDGRCLTNLKELVSAVHLAGGIIILDAAQAMAHNNELLAHCDADAICFSAHKMYAASLGVIVAKRALVAELDPFFIGGGTVLNVTESAYELDRAHPESVLEPGLQAWGEIVTLGVAIRWLTKNRGAAHAHMDELVTQLWDGLTQVPGVTILNKAPAPVVSLYADGVDGHRLATFLSNAGIMVRSGYFCAHNELIARRNLPPLVRFSLGLHNNSDDVKAAVTTLDKLVKGLS